MSKKILDACCGPRMFWFNKSHPEAVYMDVRREEFTACDNRKIVVNPDVLGDFRNIPFDEGSFKMVVFDPPHLKRAGEKSYMAQKYGKLSKNWQADIKAGFDECMRVLEPNGILVFKWNEYQIPLSKILEVVEAEPLFGHKSGKASKTHWLIFMKF